MKKTRFSKVLGGLLLLAVLFGTVFFAESAYAMEGGMEKGITEEEEMDEEDDEETYDETRESFLTGKCGDNATYSLDESTGTLTISGTGSIEDWAFSFHGGILPDIYGYKINTAVIEDGITKIGIAAFRLESLKSISIPDSVTEIDESAFSYSGLTSIEIPRAVTRINSAVFANCQNLTSVKFHDGVTEIGFGAFQATGITSIEIPKGVTLINSGTFLGCDSLTSVKIPDSVTEIGDSAFYNCRSLASIKIPDGVTKIGDSAFPFSALTSVEIPASVKTIGEIAFSNPLKKVTFLGNAPSVNPVGPNASFSASNVTLYVDMANTKGWTTPKWKGYNTVDISNSATPTPKPTAKPTAKPAPSFSDVPSNQWFYKAIEYCTVNGLVKGTSSKTFSPEQTLTRSQFVTIIGRMDGVKIKSFSGNAGFKDVSEKEYYAPYVVWAQKNKIVGGTGNGTFSPLAPITREQMSTIMNRYLDYKKVKMSNVSKPTAPFFDTANISGFAKTSVDKMRLAGILNGNGKGYFNPKEDLKRADGTAAIHNLHKKLKSMKVF
jgi:S-layer homology domain.